MGKFLAKISVFFIAVEAVLAVVNYKVDPANLFHPGIVDEMVTALCEGDTIIVNGDVDEGYFKEKMISHLNYDPKTVIIGSSHVMYMDWESLYPSALNAGMSGSYLGDYYAVIGLLKANNIKPDRIVIGVDAWAFTRGVDAPRHTTLSGYEDFAVRRIVDANAKYNEQGMENLEKYSELLSIPYFQSSVTNICENGIDQYLKNNKGMSEQIKRCDSKEPDINSNKITPSMRYIMATNSYNTVKRNDTLADASINTPDIYQLGKEYRALDRSIFNRFTELVDYLLHEGIEVHFYLPSYYPKIYDLIENSSDYHGVIELEEAVRNMAKSRRINVHGTYNPYVAGLTNEDFADVLHIKPDVMIENYLYTQNNK